VRNTSASAVTVGVDVGGPRKGFHAVALHNRVVLDRRQFFDAGQVARWCLEVGAITVGVDAPISWSRSGRARTAEKQLMASRIQCFSTPSEAVAVAHPTDHYGWMRNGAALYDALKQKFSLYDGRNRAQRPLAFETFPHAITCALSGEVVSARHKGKTRRALLAQLHVSCDRLTNIDLVDAALCAIAAECVASGCFTEHGDLDEGFIVIPSTGRASGFT